MPESFNHFEVRRYYDIRVPGVRLSDGREWRGPCPIHKGKRWNFAVNADSGLWNCFSKCGRGGDIIGLERELAGADFLSARRNVYGIIGRELPENFRNTEERRRFARRRASALNLAESARRWHHATVAALQIRKDTEPVFSDAWIASCRELFISEHMSPREILDAYVRTARERPEETSRRIKWAEEEECECAHTTAVVVQILAEAERVHDAS